MTNVILFLNGILMMPKIWIETQAPTKSKVTNVTLLLNGILMVPEIWIKTLAPIVREIP